MLIKWESYEVELNMGDGVFMALKDESDVDAVSMFRPWELLSMDEKLMVKLTVDMIERNMTALVHELGPKIIENEFEQECCDQAQA
jgi:hypothetical protein